jgi:predicted Zn-dependent protease
VVLERSGRWQEAGQCYARAAQLDPRSPDPVFNMAVMAWREKRWADVVEQMEEVLRRSPGHPEALRYLPRARENLRNEHQ